MRGTVKIVLPIFALAFSAGLSSAWATDSIVGTWRLLSWSEEETDSKAVHKTFGDNPSGLFTFTADGRMMIIFADSTRKAPAGPTVTDTEAAQLWRTMVAFAGRYKTDGDKLTLYPDVASNPRFNGAELARFFEIRGDRLQIKTTPAVSPQLGKETVVTAVWEPVK